MQTFNKMKPKYLSILISGLLTTIILFSISGNSLIKAQRLSFNYRRSIGENKNGWYTITMPADLYKNCNQGFSDIRIIGVTDEGENIEAPYLVKSWNSGPEYINIDFKGINQSHRHKRYYYTFIVPSNKIINTIQIRFDEKNYDRLIQLEGSNNQQTWYEFLKNYRILSIHEDDINYTHQTIRFDPVKYKYIRISFKSSYKPGKLKISMAQCIMGTGGYHSYFPDSIGYSNDEGTKKTELIVKLHEIVPVSYFEPVINSKNDYYRSYDLECATDSFQYNGAEWRYIYRNVSYGTISSLDSNIMHFENTLTNRIKLTIKNNDNAPLQIKNAHVKGNVDKIIVRFDKEAEYFLYYGNPELSPPKYDIVAFEDKIPEYPENLNLGDEEHLNKKKITISASKENIIYIWLALGIVIIMMGAATIHMIKNYKKTD